jgi:hypothetical protein
MTPWTSGFVVGVVMMKLETLTDFYNTPTDGDV